MSQDFNKKLGLRIRELRQLKNLKQSELADKLNMERSNLTRIESGKQCPNYENLEKIASVLDVKLKDLFDFELFETTKEELLQSTIEMLQQLSKEELLYINKSITNLRFIVK